MKLQGQVIWITGASSGVGEGMARVFHREGASLVLSARRQAELERVKASCQGPGTIDILPFDICDAAARAAAATGAGRFGRYWASRLATTTARATKSVSRWWCSWSAVGCR